MLQLDEVKPGMSLEFTGPARPGEHELLQPGARLTVERYGPKGIMCRFFYHPKEYVRFPFEGGTIARLIRFDPMRQRLEEDREMRNKAVQEYYEQFRGQIDDFTERSKTDRQRQEEQRLNEAASEREEMLRRKFPEIDPFPAEPLEDIPQDHATQKRHPFEGADSRVPVDEPTTPEERKRVETWRKLQQLRLRGKT